MEKLGSSSVEEPVKLTSDVKQKKTKTTKNLKIIIIELENNSSKKEKIHKFLHWGKPESCHPASFFHKKSLRQA